MKRPLESRILDALHELYTPVLLDEFPVTVMRVLRKVIDTDIASYTEVSPLRARAVGVIDVPGYDMDDVSKRFGALLYQHPIINHFKNTGDESARKVTDFVSQEEFENLALYWEIYRPMGMRRQMAINIGSPDPVMLGAVVNRERRDFSNAEREALNIVGRHLDQAYRNAELLTRLEDERAALNAATAAAGLGVLIVDGAGNVVSYSGPAERLLSLIGADDKSGSALPDEVKRWFLALIAATVPAVLSQRLNVACRGGASVVMIRWVGSPRPGRHTLTLEADPAAITPTAIAHAGLTQREGEVLQWIAQGKTNNDIAAILGSSPRTVQKHVERLLKKLNVETRVAAVARAREL